MGAYRPHTREIGPDVVKASTVIVDTYEGALNEATFARELGMALQQEFVSTGIPQSRHPGQG